VLSGRSASELRQLAVSRGMQTLEQSALRLVRAGQSTLEEMHRVLMTE
jgi:type II secretory ATPase GspE/PulE/Tfp pilus assembly ATPase PilB-like protein